MEADEIRNRDETFSRRNALLFVLAEAEFPTKAAYLGLADISPGRESAWEVCMGQPSMDRRIETSEARIFRNARQGEILCRLTYEVTPFGGSGFRWFLLGIEELE